MKRWTNLNPRFVYQMYANQIQNFKTEVRKFELRLTSLSATVEVCVCVKCQILLHHSTGQHQAWYSE